MSGVRSFSSESHGQTSNLWRWLLLARAAAHPSCARSLIVRAFATPAEVAATGGYRATTHAAHAYGSDGWWVLMLRFLFWSMM